MKSNEPTPLLDLMSTEDFARLLGIDEVTARRWRAAGRGPRWIKLSNRVRYRREAVEAWLTEHEQVPAVTAEAK